MRSLTIITEPSKEPVSVKEAKDYARIDYTADDAIVHNMIKAARKQIEEYTGVGLGIQKVKYIFPVECYSESQSLPRRPFRETVSISYKSCRLSAAVSVLTENINWEILGENFSGEKGTYEIVYKTGFEEVPADLILAVKVQVAYQYENRATEKGMGLCSQAASLAKPYKLNVWGI
jgi:hypothetical protein